MRLLSDCAHSTRFTTIGGEEACETCARITGGWKGCRDCDNLVPPDERWCEFHQPEGMVACPDCIDGEVECDELDCHGEFCERGWAVCQTCGGETKIPDPGPVDRVGVG